MNAEATLQLSYICSLLVFVSVFIAIIRSKVAFDYKALATFAAVQAVHASITTSIMFYRRYTGLSVKAAYLVLFDSHWLFLIAESLLLIAVMFNVFSVAMRPFEGLQRVGRIIFQWIAAISLAMTLSLAIGSRFLTAGFASTVTFTGLADSIQQGINVLLICLMLFVCFAVRPLGLTLRSRIFGVSVGLGIYATSQLAETATVALAGVHSIYSPVFLIGAIGGLLAFVTWGVYFLAPEPKPRMVILPTTSPYFTWNKVSQVLGDDPGSVVISGFTPEMLAPGELHVLTAMSKSTRSRARLDDESSLLPLTAA